MSHRLSPMCRSHIGDTYVYRRCAHRRCVSPMSPSSVFVHLILIFSQETVPVDFLPRNRARWCPFAQEASSGHSLLWRGQKTSREPESVCLSPSIMALTIFTTLYLLPMRLATTLLAAGAATRPATRPATTGGAADGAADGAAGGAASGAAGGMAGGAVGGTVSGCRQCSWLRMLRHGWRRRLLFRRE